MMVFLKKKQSRDKGIPKSNQINARLIKIFDQNVNSLGNKKRINLEILTLDPLTLKLFVI